MFLMGFLDLDPCLWFQGELKELNFALTLHLSPFLHPVAYNRLELVMPKADPLISVGFKLCLYKL